jgi:DNA-binding MarR family transcriptional regulator
MTDERLGSSTAWRLLCLADFVECELARGIEDAGLSWRGFLVLDRLVCEGPSSQRRLGAHLDIDKSQMVALIDRLEGRGFVRRERDEQDRRAYRVILTADGRDAISSAYAAVEGVDRSLLSASWNTDDFSKSLAAAFGGLISDRPSRSERAGRRISPRHNLAS